MIKTSLSIDRSHTHGKTLRPTPSIVNIYSIDMTKYQEGFSAESQSILLKKPLFTKIRDEENDLPSCDTEHLCAKYFFLIFGKRLFQQNRLLCLTRRLVPKACSIPTPNPILGF